MDKLAILASGTGSNARKIIDYFADHPRIEVALVASNRPSAPVLSMAAERGVPTLVLDRETFYEKETFLETLRERGLSWIVLAGFLWLIPDYLVRAYAGRMVNIHPALLPRFGGHGMYGMHVHRAVSRSGAPESGITIHWVNERYDEGAVLFQASTAIQPGEAPASIARKVQVLEHRHFAPVLERLILHPGPWPPLPTARNQSLQSS